MSPQADYVVSNGTGAAVRSDINGQLSAIVTQNSGATEPATTYAFMRWADTTAGVMKMRNGANSAWITLYQLDGEWSTIAFENGTAAAPSIYFKDSGTDTGFYSPGANQVGISTGGTARLTIDSNGNVDIDSNTLYVDATNNRVGLGTSSPGSLLQVGTGALSSNNVAAFLGGSTTFENTTTGSGPSITFNNDTDTGILNPSANTIGINTGGNRAITISDAQRVGIGTSPSYKLDVYEASSSGVDFRLRNTDGEFMIRVNDDAAIQQANTIIFRNSAETERARIDSSGRLLVGTSTSTSGAGGEASVQVAGTSSAGNIHLGLFQFSNSADGGELNLGSSRGTSVGSFTAIQDGDPLGRIRFAGANGSNLSTAGAFITAKADGQTWASGDCPTRLEFSTTADGASSPTERMRIGNNGSVFYGQTSTETPGVGNTTTGSCLSYGVALSISRDGNPPLALNRNTSDGSIALFHRNGTQVGRIDVTTTATSYITSSDYRLKENVVPLTGAADRLNQLQVHRFNFIADPDKTVDGFVAHEAQAVVPECVTGTKDQVDADGNPVYQGIDQSKLVPLLTAALQEALAKIETLEARLTKAGI
jgi:hypothetical protein